VTNLAIIYVRVSTPGQAEDGLGQEAQLETCQRIAAEHGLSTPDGHVVVEQASGEYLERGGLDRVRALVRSKQVAALICYDTDRLSRNEIGTVILLDEARQAGVTIYTRSGPVDASREGNLISYVRGYASALEKDKIRQRTLDGKWLTAKRGILPIGTGSGLFGYNYMPRDRASKRPQARSVNQAEAAVVHRIFGMALEGLGVNTIAAALNREGIPSKQGGLWHAHTVGHLLRNPAYTGRTLYGREVTKLLERGRVARSKRDAAEVITIEGFTPPIIDTATFERVEAHLNRPRRSGRAHQPYMLSGMLRCGLCGTGLVGQSMKRGQFRYYTCRATSPTATRPQACHARRTRIEKVDGRIWSAVSKAVANPTFLYDRVRAHQQVAGDVPRGSDDGAALRARIKGLANEEKNLLAALRAAPSAGDGIAGELEKIAHERKGLERALASVAPREAPGTQEITPEAITAFCKAVEARLRSLSVEDKTALLSLLGFEATLGDNGDVKASITVPTAGPALCTGAATSRCSFNGN